MPFAFSARVSHTSKQITSGKIGLLMLALGCVAPAAAQAAPGDCVFGYYKEKPANCADVVLGAFRALGANPGAKERASMSAGLGFLSGVFQTSESETARVLAQESTPFLKTALFRALLHAGKVDEAKRYALSNGGSDADGLVAKAQAKPLGEVKPSADPGENDLLIGAYMATGKADYIRAILENYSSADDQMTRDALRMGFMQSQGGGSPRDGMKTLMVTMCERYECKADQLKIKRLATLGSAVWALQSLARKDDGIKNAFASYIDGHAKFKQAMQDESAAFNNYRTLMIAYAAVKDNANLNESLSLYEKLAPAADTLKPMMNQPPKKL